MYRDNVSAIDLYAGLILAHVFAGDCVHMTTHFFRDVFIFYGLYSLDADFQVYL